MNRKGWKGSVTVFFSLTCVLFLCLICSIVESVRIQGARAQTANIAGIGAFSLLGEFEQKLLEKYDIFALDASYGKGDFQKKAVDQRLKEFVTCNTEPEKEKIAAWCFEPWNLTVSDSEVTDYVLLTDEKGEPFYQQAVAYMKTNLGTAAISKLLEYVQDAQNIEEKQEEYEKNKTNNEKEMTSLETQKQQKIEQLESEAAGERNDDAAGGNAIIEIEKKQELIPENPLQEIAKLRKRSVLEIVTWDKVISDKKISKKGLPSSGKLKKGTYKIEKEYSGLTANVLFREYLLEYFVNYLDGENDLDLDYQMEYIVGGKTSDQDNLKYVVFRLMLLREGMNYLYCMNDAQMSMQAGSLATALTGFLGIPALTSATKHALLLAWAYGESLIDIRVLLDGGKIPIHKDPSTWALALENLGKITELLEKGAADTGKGLAYRDYLRILLHMGSLSKQKLRALDLVQLNLQKENGMKNFKAENCIVAVKTNTKWRCDPVFLRLPQVVMGVSEKDLWITQKSSMQY